MGLQTREIENKKYTMWNLLKRWRLFDLAIIMIICDFVVFIIVMLLPGLLKEVGVLAGLIVVCTSSILIYSRLYLEYRKIKKITNNLEILHTRVNKVRQFYRSPIIGGSIWIYSSYFDEESRRQYFFKFTGDIRKKLNEEKNFLQGPTIYDLRTIDVCVNRDNYKDYVVLFDEELNLGD